MDQLKEILKYKFWLISLVALILPPIGWWMATEKLAADTDAREKEIQNAFTKVPKTTNANKSWVAEVKDVNGALSKVVEQTQAQLYDRQAPAMTWPEIIEKQFIAYNVKLRGDIDPKVRRQYPLRYAAEWEQVRKIVEPIEASSAGGKVYIPARATGAKPPLPRAPVEEWNTHFNFTSGNMWEVQEDLWMMRALMNAIARTNEGATDISNAPIKKLTELKLRGGSLRDLTSRRAGKASARPAGAAPPQSLSRGMSTVLNKASSGGGGPPPLNPSGFDPDDVFGFNNMMTVESNDKKSEGAAGEIEGFRYAQFEPGKWRARGFVLDMIMDQRRIPDLIAALYESPFVVEIRHVESYSEGGVAGSDVGSLSATPAGQPLKQVDPAADEVRLRNEERLKLALNQAYLSTVIVAGTMTIYERPASYGQLAILKPDPKEKSTSGSGATPAAARATPATSTTPAGSNPAPSAPKVAPAAAPAAAVPKSPAAPSPATPATVPVAPPPSAAAGALPAGASKK